MLNCICEETAHQAGFIVSVGNWITPDGSLITGEDYENHHWETLKKHLEINQEEIDNHLEFMNKKIQDGFIRLVFRSDILFQVGCGKKEEIWDEIPNLITMRNILAKVPELEIHIFSKKFYIIGLSREIINKKFDRLEIKEEC